MVDTAFDNDRQRFDQWSESYEHSFLQWLIFDRVHRAVITQQPTDFTPMSILDIGCGTGRLLRRMHSRWPDAVLVGIDPSDGMISKAHQLTPIATLYQAFAEHIPMQDASVDLVTSTMSFHHWINQVQGVNEIFRVLRPKGIFTLADTNIGHGHPLTRRQVKDLFRSSGLSVISQINLVPLLTITLGEKSLGLPG